MTVLAFNLPSLGLWCDKLSWCRHSVLEQEQVHGRIISTVCRYQLCLPVDCVFVLAGQWDFMDDHSQRWHGLLHRILENWEGHAYRGTDCINPFLNLFFNSTSTCFWWMPADIWFPVLWWCRLIAAGDILCLNSATDSLMLETRQRSTMIWQWNTFLMCYILWLLVLRSIRLCMNVTKAGTPGFWDPWQVVCTHSVSSRPLPNPCSIISLCFLGLLWSCWKQWVIEALYFTNRLLYICLWVILFCLALTC